MPTNQRKGTKDLVVGLDCSTTSTKAIAFDKNGSMVARASEPIPLSSPGPNLYEQNPDDWWLSAQRALSKIIQEIDPQRIAALAISNQRETFVPLDKDGHPLRPAIVWLDERCKDEVGPFSKRIGIKNIHRITGKPPDYAPVVYRLAWMKKHEPHLFKKIGMICDVHTYLVWKLTGLFRTSWASADPLGLLDIKKKKWSPCILAELSVNERQVPGLARPGSVLGRITSEASASTGLSADTLVVAGGGDGQAAGLGSNVLRSDCAYLNLGTAVVAGVYGSLYRTSTAFRTMCSCSGRGYYYECSLRAGTFALDWFIKNILTIDPLEHPEIYEQLEHEAQSAPVGSNGLFHLPYLCGAMNPYWDVHARGAFVGLASSHTRGALYRSILEGIAYEQCVAVHAVEKSIGTSVRTLMAIGGGAASTFWCRILADSTGKTICLPENMDASALGAAIDASVGAGWYGTCKEAAGTMTAINKVIRPDPVQRKQYERLFAVYKRIYPSLRLLRA